MYYRFEITSEIIQLIHTVNHMNRTMSQLDPDSKDVHVISGAKNLLLADIGLHIQRQWGQTQEEGPSIPVPF
ncbi:MAG: hypothetical protein P8176_09215 [Gammaproteobacteria bacterium]|jgi:hypothetical protein